LCRSASVIVAIHGAGATNVVFNDGCKVVEIFPPDYVPAQYFYQISGLLGHEYWYLIGEKDEDSKWGDVTVNLERLRGVVDPLLVEMPARLLEGNAHPGIEKTA
jgi:capsular polysaccharide biosynthesis protein